MDSMNINVLIVCITIVVCALLLFIVAAFAAYVDCKEANLDKKELKRLQEQANNLYAEIEILKR